MLVEYNSLTEISTALYPPFLTIERKPIGIPFDTESAIFIKPI